MPRNGSGTYSLPAGNPVVTGTTISSTVHNNTMTDIGSEITNSLDKDGQTVVAGTIDFNANKIVLDGDGDTSIHASTDDVIDIEIEGADAIKLGWQSVADTGFVTVDPNAFTADATENTHRLAVLNTNAITVPTGTTALASSVYITEPNITATGTVTEAATVYIAGAPTEGASNYSLFVDAGNVRFDGDLDVAGNLAFTKDLKPQFNSTRPTAWDTNSYIWSKSGGSSGLHLDGYRVYLSTGNSETVGLEVDVNQNVNIPNGNLDVSGEITSSGGTALATAVTLDTPDSVLCPTLTITRNGAGTSANDLYRGANSGGTVFSVSSDGGINGASLEVGTWSATGVTNGVQLGSGQSISSRTITTNATHSTFYNPNGSVGNITTSGSATAFNTSSDPRLKSEFTPITGASEMILEARDQGMIGEFHFLSDDTQKVWGYNAHKVSDLQSGFGGTEGQGPRELELGAVYEEAVMGERPVMIPKLDAEGNTTGEMIESGEMESYEVSPEKIVVPAGVDQSKRVPILEAAIGELLDRIAVLETSNSDLQRYL